jgi:biotin carboxyl carrier protein
MESRTEGGTALTAELKYLASVGQQTFGIRLISSQLLEIDGNEVNFDFKHLQDRSFSLILGTKSFVVEHITNNDSVILKNRNTEGILGMTAVVSIKGKEYAVMVDDDRSLLMKKFVSKPRIGSGAHVVRAPMPGLISRLEVDIGEEVEKGRGLLVLEAMKMENEIRAPGKGRVKAIHVQMGMAVEKDQPLVTVEEL